MGMFVPFGKEYDEHPQAVWEKLWNLVDEFYQEQSEKPKKKGKVKA